MARAWASALHSAKGAPRAPTARISRPPPAEAVAVAGRGAQARRSTSATLQTEARAEPAQTTRRAPTARLAFLPTRTRAEAVEAVEQGATGRREARVLRAERAQRAGAK